MTLDGAVSRHAAILCHVVSIRAKGLAMRAFVAPVKFQWTVVAIVVKWSGPWSVVDEETKRQVIQMPSHGLVFLIAEVTARDNSIAVSIHVNIVATLRRSLFPIVHDRQMLSLPVLAARQV